MSKRPHPADRGLRAVQRVRSLREEGARRQLAAANASKQAAQVAVDDAVTAWHDLDGLGPAQNVPDLLRHQSAAASVAQQIQVATEHLQDVAASTHVLQQQWMATKTDLSAIEGLLERRAEARAEERSRAEAKEADDVNTRRQTNRDEESA